MMLSSSLAQAAVVRCAKVGSGRTLSSAPFLRPAASALGAATTPLLSSKRQQPRSRAFRVSPRAAASASTSANKMAGPKGKVLISVSDKTGLVDLVKGLTELGYEIVSTGGSATAIEKAGFVVQRVEELTGFPEMLDGVSHFVGRVKTLHPGVHGGILARRDLETHTQAIEKHNITPIDVVVVNLYPFRKTVTAKPAPSYELAVENIDIGGPAMIRAAAKNHDSVSVVVDAADYAPLLAHLGAAAPSREEGLALRRRLAWKAYQHTASYDAMVAEWFWTQVDPSSPAPAVAVPMTLVQSLRYGENPHQKAAFYADDSLAEAGMGGVASSRQHHGKEMSYNNYLDADAAYGCVCDLEGPACVVVKHTNPCGVAVSDDLHEAYHAAVRADPISAFGGIVAFNRTLDAELAREIREFRSPTDGQTRMFYEIVIAPAYTEEGLAVLKGKSKDLRILEAAPRAPSGRALRQVAGGWLVQDADALAPRDIEFTVVSEKQPTPEQLEDLKFAWTCVKHVKSNAITVAKGNRLLGMGSGQPNRVKSVQIALEKAGEEVKGSAMASDAFFPFSWNDSVELACKAGVAAIVHPGGSLRDKDAIECCNKYGVALLTTGVRHFRH